MEETREHLLAELKIQVEINRRMARELMDLRLLVQELSREVAPAPQRVQGSGPGNL